MEKYSNPTKEKEFKDYASSLYKSSELERSVLHCILLDSGWLGEISHMIDSEFFVYPPHKKIYSCISACFNEKKVVDRYIVATRLKLLGLSKIDSLDTEEYIDVLFSLCNNPESRQNYLEELTKLYYARKSYSKLKLALDFLDKKVGELTFTELQSGVEKLVVEAVTENAVNLDDSTMCDFFGDYAEILDNRVRIKERSGIPFPFENLNRWIGSMSFGDMVVVAAKYKVGKSTFLDFIGTHAAISGKGAVKVLNINTELEEWRSIARHAAARTGISEYYFNKGKFAEDPEKVKKVKALLEEIGKYKGLMSYKFMPDMTAEKVESLVRRFHSKNVDVSKGESLLVTVDYFKDCNSGNEARDRKEYELIGAMATSFKNLASTTPNCTFCVAIQTNREGLLAQSDRVNWVASTVLLLDKKTPEEVATHGSAFGTHTLKILATRNWGEFGEESGPVKRENSIGKSEYLTNFINYKFDNFNVIECGTLRDIIRKGGQLTPSKPQTVMERRANLLDKRS